MDQKNRITKQQGSEEISEIDQQGSPPTARETPLDSAEFPLPDDVQSEPNLVDNDDDSDQKAAEDIPSSETLKDLSEELRKAILECLYHRRKYLINLSLLSFLFLFRCMIQSKSKITEPSPSSHI